jgi:hypothetical protein
LRWTATGTVVPSQFRPRAVPFDDGWTFAGYQNTPLVDGG